MQAQVRKYMNRASLCLFLCFLMVMPAALTVVSADQEPLENESAVVPQFGTGFEETVIADSSDNLNKPRDLEFHPGANRNDELWVVNRATDSVTIVYETGTPSQWSENLVDAYANHFMEEVSAISFGSYNNEFDYQFGTAQESRNTFNGQQSPNNFMGPTLWPSSPTHFAKEHQADDLLGSHIDMLHESPNGMGIAWDSGNAYWYFDGYYGELVFYDFAEDHDTGEDDHADGVVRRYADIVLTRFGSIPGHMVMDQSTGILYISDTGTGRVLWVDTDDTTTTSSNIYGDSSRMEPLSEYSSISGLDWGVLASGLSRPSGIALDGDTLFVSQNGNGKISAFDLAQNGESATIIDTVQTAANSIMGLEIGPSGSLYYVDANFNKVIRLDPFDDIDGDGVEDSLDNCINDYNPNQENLDSDAQGDVCDDDDDNDGIMDISDSCALGMTGWTSSSSEDHDGDGCNDSSEDDDDDQDGIDDLPDRCPKGQTGWVSSQQTDHDGDGCQDASEDKDDDADGLDDDQDNCPLGRVGFTSNSNNDRDRDGCEDSAEDTDDDNDGISDDIDQCPNSAGDAIYGTMVGCSDFDGDGWADSEDEYPLDSTQWADSDGDGYGDNIQGTDPDGCPTISGDSTLDRLGCSDSDEDGYSNADDDWDISDGADAFPFDNTQWANQDGDEYGDNPAGYQPDECKTAAGNSTEDRLGCVDSDGDGWSDEADAFPSEPSQYLDYDSDGFGDSPIGANGDQCPLVYGTSTQGSRGCPDSDQDSWSDEFDAFPQEAMLWSDTDGDGFADQTGSDLSDDCPDDAGQSTSDRKGCLDSDGDGVSDETDFYPKDAARSVEVIESDSFLWLAIPVVLIFALLGIGLFIKKSSPDAPQMPQLTQALAAGPPIPPEGIPPGWTMEQWSWYGADWLKERMR
ncbi:MAG TPA: hypothetical protein EYQ73_05330 [Candidatus Poseidoniales archaeon]|nr:hypothetical protein [Candidatus Poseidoniales archaeon]HIL64643.1 hypothetical protein [Candidatus Poseidoniales archaeon]